MRWLHAFPVPRETFEHLRRYVALLHSEAAQQNLVSTASLEHVWARHIVDAVQLLHLAPKGNWVDLGSGAGLPGLIVALVGRRPVTLIEPRRRRVEFLNMVIEAIGLESLAQVIPRRVELVTAPVPVDVVSARAFAPLPRLFSSARHLTGPRTRWILPKGRSASSEVEAARGSWQGHFELMPSVTDPAAAIVVASDVCPKDKR